MLSVGEACSHGHLLFFGHTSSGYHTQAIPFKLDETMENMHSPSKQTTITFFFFVLLRCSPAWILPIWLFLTYL
jgi:hypothetical protein